MARAVRWDLIADPRRFNAGFRQAERTSTRFQRHMDRVDQSMTRSGARFAALGGAAAGAAGAGIAALGGLAAAGVTLGLKTAAGLESAEIGFTQLLKSSKRAKTFIGELKTFAAKTPFELPGLVDASRALLGAGTEAKKVIPIMTALGDASGALGLDQERFGRVMTAVTQIMNKGKVQAEELMQINEAGIPVWQLLAKATGKPVPELQKLMEQGKLLAKDTLPLLFEQMHKDYGGGMERQSRSLAGVWSTFKDTVSLTLSDTLQPLLPWLKEKLPGAADTFKAAVERVQTFFTEDLRPELRRMRQAWDDNSDAIKGLISTLFEADGQLDSTKDNAKSFADTVVVVTTTLGQLSRLLQGVTDKLNLIEDASDTAGAAIHDNFILPVGRGVLWMWDRWAFASQKIIGVAATVAEALHLPQAKALRKAEQDIRAFRENYNKELDKLLDETVNITASPKFTFSKNFTQDDWLAARRATGRMRTGGKVGGSPAGRDSQLRWLDPDEHVWTGAEVLAAGGHGAMERWRRAVLRGDVPGMRSGGAILPNLRIGALPPQIGQLPSARHGIASLMGDWGGKILVAALRKLVPTAIPHSPGSWRLATNYLSRIGVPYSIISTFRPGARTHATGAVSFHALNRAVDLDGGHDKLRIFNALARTNPTELIFSRAGRYKSRSGWHPIGRLDPVTRSDHFGHVHAAYDRGGWLMPGWTMAYNGTGRPEPVGAAAGNTYGPFNITINGVTGDNLERRVERAVLAALDERDRQARAGARR